MEEEHFYRDIASGKMNVFIDFVDIWNDIR